MKKALLFSILFVVWGCWPNITLSDINETVSVTAKAKDNPQQYEDDIEGHFDQSPNANPDRIHVTNHNVKYVNSGVYNDPINDSAMLSLYSQPNPVKVTVEGRAGIGAMYWVTVTPFGPGEGGHGSPLWADVEDVEREGTLILKDRISGRGKSDSTDSDSDAPTLHCEVDESDDKGKIKFWLLQVPSGTYDYQIRQGGTVIESNTMAHDANVSKDLNPNEYDVTVTKAGGFSRNIKFCIVQVQMTAYRQQTSPFARIDVPDDKEEDPGAGIRINDDDDDTDGTKDRVDNNGVTGENDLIEITLKTSQYPASTDCEYVLKRANDKIEVWTSQTKDSDSKISFEDNEAIVAMTGAEKTIWVEWVKTSHGATDLEWSNRVKTECTTTSLDKIHFYTFTGVVIVLSGEQTPLSPLTSAFGCPAPSDPAGEDNGIYQAAIDLHREGYYVHMYGENSVDRDGAGSTYDAVVLDIQNHKTGNVAIFGYSHGGGSTYDLANRLNTRRNTIGTFEIKYTAYIDAVENDSDADIEQETRRPPSSSYHANYYQIGVSDIFDIRNDYGVDGGPISSTPGADYEINVEEEWCDSYITHFDIDDIVPLLDDLKSRLENQLNR